MRKLFVTGIGTGIGKTVVSAVLTETLKADYWKPVQCGELDNTDTMKVSSLISNTSSVFHPEAYRLSGFMSPHAAAPLDGVEISLNNIIIPDTDNTLVMEGAGGLMVPLNSKDLVIDLIGVLRCEVVVVSQNYLGSINHTLLTLAALKHRELSVAGIIFNGEENRESEKIILEQTGAKLMGRIEQEKEINPEIILKYANKFNDA
jgi:dethiobiotin synthetase